MAPVGVVRAPALTVVVASLLLACTFLTPLDELTAGDARDGALAEDAPGDGNVADGGSPCTAAPCPVTIATGPSKVSEMLAVSATDVFWGSADKTVRRCPLTGCGSTAPSISNDELKIWGVAVGAGKVYWTNDNDPAIGAGRVASAPLGGGPVTTLMTGRATGIVVDATRVLWAVNPGAIMTCPNAGCAGAPTAFLSNIPTPKALAIGGTNLYWNAGKTLNVCPLVGCGAPTVLWTSPTNVFSIAADANAVYFTDDQNPGSVSKCAASGCGSGPTVIASNLAKPHAIATDGANVYWTNKDGNGSVMKCPVSGCPDGKPVVIAQAQPNPKAIAVDATHVYWANDNGTVATLEK